MFRRHRHRGISDVPVILEGEATGTALLTVALTVICVQPLECGGQEVMVAGPCLDQHRADVRE